MLSNSLLASTTSESYYALEVMRLRQADAQARLSLQKAQASGGTVTNNVSYTIGPDGARYATGGTVTTTTREDGTSDRKQLPLQTLSANKVNKAAAKELAALPERGAVGTASPKTLGEALSNKLALSPIEFALAFSQNEPSKAEQLELQIVDGVVRSQETLHFRAAGGLATGLPSYGTQAGPGGELFATSGHVDVQSSGSNDPAKAAREAFTIHIAATAPGDASAQDFSVARSALSQAAFLYQQQATPRDELSVNITG